MNTYRFQVTETFTTRLLGSAPANKQVYADFIAGKKAEAEERRAKASERFGVETVASVGTIEEELGTIREETGATCFHNDLGQTTEDGLPGLGLFLYDYQIAGYWKEAAESLAQEHGVKQVRSKLDNFMFITPRRVYIRDGNEALTEPDGKLERPLRAMTAQGPRVTLACSEIVNPGRVIGYTMEFLPYIKVGTGREAKALDVDHFVEIVSGYGKFKGRGQWRNGGNGRMTIKITALKE